MSVQCYQSLTLVIMPSAVENAALLFGGAVAGTALTTAFVAPGPVAQEAKTGLRASGYSGSQSSSGMGTMAGMGAIAGLAAAGVAQEPHLHAGGGRGRQRLWPHRASGGAHCHEGPRDGAEADQRLESEARHFSGAADASRAQFVLGRYVSGSCGVGLCRPQSF